MLDREESVVFVVRQFGLFFIVFNSFLSQFPLVEIQTPSVGYVSGLDGLGLTTGCGLDL